MDTSSDEWRVFSADCKDCGKPHYYSATALKKDLARGLSAPERCKDCRQENARGINAKGAAYWTAQEETDDSRRAWGTFGLFRLDHGRKAPVPIDFSGQPSDERLLERFAPLQPIADGLIRNLL